MKPFNLEQAKQGKKVVTRDGREFMFGAHNPNASKMERLVGWIGVGGGQLVVSSWSEEGKGFTNYDSPADLFMATEKKTVYIAISNDDNGLQRLTTNACFSEDELQTYFSRGTVMSEPHQIVSFEIEV